MASEIETRLLVFIYVCVHKNTKLSKGTLANRDSRKIHEYINFNRNVVGMEYEELYQEGCLALCKAAVNYDDEKAIYKTFAVTVVKNSLITYCNKINREEKKRNCEEDADDYNLLMHFEYSSSSVEEKTVLQAAFCI